MSKVATSLLSGLAEIVQRYNERSGDSADVDGLLVSLLRSCFIAKEGHAFLIADFAQIEARVICWLAYQLDALEEFRDYDGLVGDERRKRDPYRIMAGVLFGIAPEDTTTQQRLVGKILVLGAGFGLGARGFGIFAASQGVDLAASGVTPKQCIDAFRQARPKLVLYWRAVEKACIQVISGEEPEIFIGRTLIKMRGEHLKVKLPSGRFLTYPFAKVEELVPAYCATLGIPAHTKPTMTYHDQRRQRIPTYGGKLAENITQAVASDFLRHAKLQHEDAGLPVVLDVHDEDVPEVPLDGAEEKLSLALSIMETVPAWAPDFPLKAEGQVACRYTK